MHLGGTTLRHICCVSPAMTTTISVAAVVVMSVACALMFAVFGNADGAADSYLGHSFDGAQSLVAWSFAQHDDGGDNDNDAHTYPYDVDLSAGAYPDAVSYIPRIIDGPAGQLPVSVPFVQSDSWHVFSSDPLFEYPQRASPAPYYVDGSASAILGIDPLFFDTHHNNPMYKRYLIFGSEFDTFAGSHPLLNVVSHGVASIPGNGFFTVATMPPSVASDLESMGLVVIPDSPLDLHYDNLLHAAQHVNHGFDVFQIAQGSMPEKFRDTGSASGLAQHLNVIPIYNHILNADSADAPDATGISDMLGLDYGGGNDSRDASGMGITVAIVDSGVDFSNPDIQHSLARDSVTNHPIMLDADGQGIVISNYTFYANIDKDGIVRNHTGDVPEGFDSVVYTTNDGVFLAIKQDGKGTAIPVYNSLYPVIGNAPIFNGTLDDDMKIGSSNRDYIRSQSGAYRLGAIFQAGEAGTAPDGSTRMQVVPVLVVDSAVLGLYDMVVPDMSSSWLDYTRVAGETPDFDFDFTDENPIVLGSGNEFLMYDSDDDGVTDYVAGTVGARVLDVHSVTNMTLRSHYDDVLHAVNGTLLPAIDPDGRFFGIMSDHDGHGTASSGVITSAGKMVYDIYNDTGGYTITGAAPGAKILPVKALWLGDAIYGWMWSAGFDNRGTGWKFSGEPRADIISNSWGISSFPNMGAAPGYDVISLVLDMLATPRSIDDDYPGVVMITSAGNSGHGYGTVGIPGSASFAIAVGASTNNVFVGYGPFQNQPRFGSTVADAGHVTVPNTNRGHVVDFSSRGPGLLGDVRPDLVGIGAYGFVPRSMMGHTQSSDTLDPFSLFGGTSMACPMVAGAAAVLMSHMDAMLLDYDPFIVRNILMSTAQDMHNDPFVQGAGLANAGRALDFVDGKNGIFAVSNDASYQNIREILQPAVDAANIADTGLGHVKMPDRKIPMTVWFAGHLDPGQRSTATFTIENSGEDELRVDINPYVLSLVRYTEYSGTTIPHQKDPVLADVDGYTPNYIRLADVHRDKDLGGLFDYYNHTRTDDKKSGAGIADDGNAVDDAVDANNTSTSDDQIPDTSPSSAFIFPKDASLLIVNVNFEFPDFMNMSADIYADDLGIASLYLYDWMDDNRDGDITSDELVLVTRGGSWGTVQEIRVSDPADVFHGEPIVGIYPVPLRYSYWVGANGANATSFDYTVSASYYAKEDWNAVWPTYDTITVAPRNTDTVDLSLVTFEDTWPGVHQGFVAFVGEHHTANVPVSFVVLSPVHDVDSDVWFGAFDDAVIRDGDNDTVTDAAVDSGGLGAAMLTPDVMYQNGYTMGAVDMVGRYMAGDWRNYYFDVTDDTIDVASIHISWKSPYTSISAFAVNPAGKIIQTNVPSGTFGHFLGWPSVDWLGNTPFSEGGGFYPSTTSSGNGHDGWDTSVFMNVPINGTGTYAIMTHTTLFGGESVTEPVTISIKFHEDASKSAGSVAHGSVESQQDGILQDTHTSAAGSIDVLRPAYDDSDNANGLESLASMSDGLPPGEKSSDYGAAVDEASGTASGKSSTSDETGNTLDSESFVSPSSGDGLVSYVDDTFDTFDSGFGLGLLAGVIAGGAAGSILILVILHQKNSMANTPRTRTHYDKHAAPV